MPESLDRPSSAPGCAGRPSRTDFFREEFLKHRVCLERQREYYSECAVASVEAALTAILARLDQLSSSEGGELLVSRLLRQFDVVTGLSNWTDPAQLH